MNDELHLVLVLTVFFLAITYLNFIAVRLKNRSGWTNVTCNPINLFSNSLFQTQEESNKEFKRCVEKLSTETTKAAFSEHIKKQDVVYNHQKTTLDKVSLIDTNITAYKKSVGDTETALGKNKTDIEGKITTAETLNNNTKSKVEEILNKVQTIFQNIRNYI
jgi:F0F1-type ATP synthase delta subunit